MSFDRPIPGDAPDVAVEPRASWHARVALALGIATLACGAVAVAGVVVPVVLVTGPLAVVEGVVARRQVRADPVRWTNPQVGTAGLVLGTVGLAAVLLPVVVFALFVSFLDHPGALGWLAG